MCFSPIPSRILLDTLSGLIKTLQEVNIHSAIALEVFALIVNQGREGEG